MNISLLAMSTYPSNMRHCIASYGEDREEYSYFSQLEPGCKHFIKKLGASGEKIDKIITLCTEETLTAPKDTFDKDGKPKHQFLKCGDENEEISELSPYEFFRKRMLGYIRNDDEAFAYEKKLGTDVSGYNAFSHSELYPQPEELFIKVKINRDEIGITSTIKEVINIIDDLPGKKGKPICLYLNAQGGARKNVQIVNTVLNMLQSRKYTLSEVSVIEYNDDRDATRFRMLDATSSYLINDMAAAMNAFLQYGRADMFMGYYDRYKRIHHKDKTSEDIVVEAINKISDAILLCNTDRFINGIKRLKEEIKKYNALPSENKDTFFELIEGDIEKSYKELFDSTDIIADLDILVNWCLEKNLLQQALTILEAKAPVFAFKHGFLYAEKDEDTRQKLIKLRYLPNRNKKENKDKYTINYKMDDPMYFIGNSFCIIVKKSDNDKKRKEEKLLNNLTDKNSSVVRDLIDGQFRYDLADHRSIKEEVKINLFSDWFSRSGDVFPNTEDGITEAGKILKQFVKDYGKICRLRNNTNHSGTAAITFNDLKEQLTRFNELLTKIRTGSEALGTDHKEFFVKADLPMPEGPQTTTE